MHVSMPLAIAEVKSCGMIDMTNHRYLVLVANG